MLIKISLDDEMTTRLIQEAATEKRNIVRQAEVILRRALGLPFPRVQPTPTPQKEAHHESGRA